MNSNPPHRHCPESVKAAVEATVERFGRLDIFFHNAGVAGPGRIEGTTLKVTYRLGEGGVSAGQ